MEVIGKSLLFNHIWISLLDFETENSKKFRSECKW